MKFGRHARVWLMLTTLTVASFSLGVGNGGGHGASWILLLALGKALLLGFRFMELHAAHVAWKWAFVGALGILIGALFGVASRVG